MGDNFPFSGFGELCRGMKTTKTFNNCSTVLREHGSSYDKVESSTVPISYSSDDCVTRDVNLQ